MNGSGVRVWRLTVAASGALGVWLAAQQYDVWWTALSQLANLAVAVLFVALAFREPRSPWLRGGLTTVMVVVSLAYLPMQNGNLTEPWSVVEHVVTPALVLVDFLVVGGNQAGTRWWHPLSWLLPPLAYLAWYLAADLQVYDALDPSAPALFAGRLGILLALLLATGFGLVALGRARGSVLRSAG
ncbi:hypothetical protein [Nocardioides sp. SYSU DS0663]|uniref:hypothetical protein n=1 Tax=Nocardioides sp. SYSU DS0663 TaxID=3416445 RepID=UPI003F4C9397